MREIGADFNVIRALANHPGLLDGFMRFSGAAYWGSSVPRDLRELTRPSTPARGRGSPAAPRCPSRPSPAGDGDQRARMRSASLISSATTASAVCRACTPVTDWPA